MEAMFFIIVGVQTWTSVLGYNTGAPTSVCVTMLPNHGAVGQTSPSPYKIETNSNGTFSINKSITVTIQGPDYVGLLLQARTGSDTNALGTWQTAPENTKHLQCSGNAQGAITHSNNSTKNNLTMFTWTPTTSLDSVFFTATVVRNKTFFWLNVTSAQLTKATNGTVNPGSAADLKATFTPALLLLALILSIIF